MDKLKIKVDYSTDASGDEQVYCQLVGDGVIWGNKKKGTSHTYGECNVNIPPHIANSLISEGYAERVAGYTEIADDIKDALTAGLSPRLRKPKAEAVPANTIG